MVVFQQIDFVRHLDLGFRRDNIVDHRHQSADATGMKAYADALARGPGVLGVARSSVMAFNGSPAMCCRFRSRAIRRC